MKKISIFILIFMAIFTQSCLKDTPNNDFSTVKPIVEFATSSTNGTPNAPSGGLDHFGSVALVFTSTDPVDVVFDVNLASVNYLNKDLTVTLAIDNDALTAYNADDNNAQKFDLMPDSLFSFPATTAVIKAGQRIAHVNITFYAGKFDPTKSYMLPISIKDAQGLTISGNQGTMYYHFIGSILGGSYSWDWTRWNNADGSGAPNGASFTGGTASFVPDNATQVEVQSGYGDQNGFNVRYIISFTQNGPTLADLTDFVVTLNPDDIKNNLTPNGISVTSGPKIELIDPVNKKYKFSYHVTNSAGAPRTLLDYYYAP